MAKFNYIIFMYFDIQSESNKLTAEDTKTLLEN
jgi:hypothetical protein